MASTTALWSGFSQVFAFGGSLMWIAIILPIGISLIFALLYLIRGQKFRYPCILYRDFGNGKGGFKLTRAGKFHKNRALFGLLDLSGELEFVLKDGRKVQMLSDVDMHDINEKKGFLVMQKPDDPLVVVPIQRVQIVNDKMMMDIANSDLRDVGVDIMRRAERELQSGWEKAMPYVMYTIMGIIFFISIVAVIQFAQHMHSEALKGAIELIDKARSLANTGPSGAP
jgi:hypothetical protein